jgi:phage terminase Nu1 subunit (DNA packaging protein)
VPDAREYTSWKQIADHLGINVRTAQKWERERGLPVRRPPGGRGRVAIDATILDTWKRATTNGTDTSCFRWPVDRDMIAEVRFTGASVRAMHIQRLQQYLELVKTALE